MNKHFYFDDIIDKLQKHGGISTFWHEMTSRVSNSSTFNIIRCSGTRVSRYIPVRVEQGVFHSSYYRLPLSKKVKSVVTIHDLIYELGFLHQMHSFVNTFQVKQAIRRADILVCVLENTKKDLLQIYPSLVRNSDIYVIPHGSTFAYIPDSKIKPNSRLSCIDELRCKYVIFVGKRSSYKNFELAFRAFANSKLPEHGIKLVCIGSRFTAGE